ncbi:siderophore-interacting protein [Chryseobacterium sp.]|uniref:siderophore-interacting protein n=1 Tax=Chryseobacterium sp. TaxID=1871047 RepID=UPI0025B81BF6|nr:siderophore-interacting protein [Chryseobacterium sp.]
MSGEHFKLIELSLYVNRKEYITPHYIRVYLYGDGLQTVQDNTTVGVNNKILIPPKGADKIYFPKIDSKKMQWIYPPEEVRPTIRTYTHRGVNAKRKELWIDFVSHGDEGPASAWAINAKKGDLLGVLMSNEKTELYKTVQNYVFVGDATAIPVIGSILEELPISAKGVCIIEVFDENDKQNLFTKASIELIWIYNTHPQMGSELANWLKKLPLPEEDRFAYIAAEFTTVKNIRQYLRKERLWNRDEVSAYSHWKSGISEDRSEAERRKENEPQ